jgi:hypothetical protein
MAHGRREGRDFREFVFTATGAGTRTTPLDRLDLIDNLAAEADRLEAIEDLLEMAVDPVRGPGVAVLIGDVRRRLREMIRIAAAAQARGPR